MALASKWLWQRRMAHVKPFIDSPVLDVGCGDGATSAHAPTGYVGVDRDLAPLSVRSSIAASAVQGTADRLPFGDGAFQTVLAMASLEHVDDPVACLAEARRVLAPGGRVVMTTPTPFGDRIHHWLAKIGITSKHAADEHQSVMDPQALARAVEAAGLRVEYNKVFLFGGNQVCVASAAATTLP
jgi:ubiquinone/menaquinone biosynthesis C-methylase UbiE